MPKSETIGEIVRQGRVRDFVEHMLNRGRTRAIGKRRNIYFSARFCPSVGLNESESFGFLRVLQPGMKSLSSLAPSPLPPVFVPLPNYFLSLVLQTLPRPSSFLGPLFFFLFPFLFFPPSTISFPCSFLHRVWLSADPRVGSRYCRAEKFVYRSIRRTNEFPHAADVPAVLRSIYKSRKSDVTSEATYDFLPYF